MSYVLGTQYQRNLIIILFCKTKDHLEVINRSETKFTLANMVAYITFTLLSTCFLYFWSWKFFGIFLESPQVADIETINMVSESTPPCKNHPFGELKESLVSSTFKMQSEFLCYLNMTSCFKSCKAESSWDVKYSSFGTSEIMFLCQGKKDRATKHIWTRSRQPTSQISLVSFWRERHWGLAIWKIVTLPTRALEGSERPQSTVSKTWRRYGGAGMLVASNE